VDVGEIAVFGGEGGAYVVPCFKSVGVAWQSAAGGYFIGVFDAYAMLLVYGCIDCSFGMTGGRGFRRVGGVIDREFEGVSIGVGYEVVVEEVSLTEEAYFGDEDFAGVVFDLYGAFGSFRGVEGGLVGYFVVVKDCQDFVQHSDGYFPGDGHLGYVIDEVF